MKTGRLDDGLSALTEALAAAEENENRECASEIHRLKGELLLKQDASNAPEAQRCFERAIEIARKQSAKSWELRATTSLARLLDEAGSSRRSARDARRHLRLVHRRLRHRRPERRQGAARRTRRHADVTCSKCRTENATGAKFCVECGESFKGRCPKCGLANPANAKFCQECGTSFGEAAEAKKPVGNETTDIRISSQRPVGEIPEGERKTVTALFADIKGSTELMRDLDPEEARAIVDPVLQLMMAAVHRYGGYVAQSTGDGIFALFGAPIAHEDHPQRALHAALAMQEELRRYADRLRAEGKIPVEARVGVNTGEVVVRTIETGGHTEYTPVGHVTNLAARMQTAAPAGSIAASEATQRLCEGYFDFRDLGRPR